MTIPAGRGVSRAERHRRCDTSPDEFAAPRPRPSRMGRAHRHRRSMTLDGVLQAPRCPGRGPRERLRARRLAGAGCFDRRVGRPDAPGVRELATPACSAARPTTSSPSCWPAAEDGPRSSCRGAVVASHAPPRPTGPASADVERRPRRGGRAIERRPRARALGTAISASPSAQTVHARPRRTPSGSDASVARGAASARAARPAAAPRRRTAIERARAVGADGRRWPARRRRARACRRPASGAQ